MPEYQQYRRSQIGELARWVPGFDMAEVSISEADRKAGSPKAGDMIARNPANHEDRWLVAADYFAANFEPLTVPVGETPAEAVRRFAAFCRDEESHYPNGMPWEELADRFLAQPEAEPCRIYEYDGAYKCYAHGRVWGAVTKPDEPCIGWAQPPEGSP